MDDFAEEDLGLASEDDPSSDMAVDEDPSSGMTVQDESSSGMEAKKEESSSGVLTAEESSSVALAAEEADSSADILEIAEEIDEDSSSDAMVTVRDDSELENATLSDSDVVTDMLEAGVEDSDDELDTIDLDEMDVPTDTVAEGADDLMTVIEDETVGSSADTAPMGAVADIGDEAETVSLGPQDVDTEGVTDEAGEETMAIDEGPVAEADFAPGPTRPMAGAMVEYQPAMWCNMLLFMAVVMVGFGGFIMLCEAAGATANPVVQFVKNFIKDSFPKL